MAEIGELIRRCQPTHPQAVDTERGIREWLREARRSYAVVDVHGHREAGRDR